MHTKQCSQCGEIKPIEAFRQYYGGRKGHYTNCKLCEKINSREKYLSRKEATNKITAVESTELQKIYKLWEYQRQLGLRPPRLSTGGRSNAIADNIDEMLGRYTAQVEALPDTAQVEWGPSAEPPYELVRWFSEPLTKEPEYYQDEVYTELSARFRPQIRIDKKTLLPVYDDTFKDVLLKIASRFDDYEDNYYD